MEEQQIELSMLAQAEVSSALLSQRPLVPRAKLRSAEFWGFKRACWRVLILIWFLIASQA